MTLLQRLLSYPHAAVFDLSPQAELALRVGSPWEVADGVMTVGAQDYALSDMTVAELATALAFDGVAVSYVNPEFAGRSAMVLVDASGDPSASNGDHVYAFTSILWAFMAAYRPELAEAGNQVHEAIRQMVITQAEGYWLDVWGGLYGVERPVDLPDEDYQALIPEEAFRIRVNAIAIEAAVLERTGEDIKIFEPWRRMFFLDESKLSGEDRMADDAYYNYHVIHPIGRPGYDREAVLGVVNRNRAAGVVVYEPGYEIPGTVTEYDYDAIAHSSALTREFYRLVPYPDRALLDYAEYGEISILNHESRRRRQVLHASHSVLSGQYWAEFGWLPTLTWGTDTIIRSQRSRTYRVHYLNGGLYTAQSWLDNVTWMAPETWSSLNVMITSKHTSTS